MDPPETLSYQQVGDMRRAALILVDGRIYKNEDGVFRRLSDRCYASVEEMADGS